MRMPAAMDRYRRSDKMGGSSTRMDRAMAHHRTKQLVKLAGAFQLRESHQVSDAFRGPLCFCSRYLAERGARES
jgi:hypothetical protein